MTLRAAPSYIHGALALLRFAHRFDVIHSLCFLGRVMFLTCYLSSSLENAEKQASPCRFGGL